MKKTPIYYNDQVVGYIDDMVYNNDVLEFFKIYLFHCHYYDDVVNSIKKSIYSTLGDNKIYYKIQIDGDIITCKIKN